MSKTNRLLNKINELRERAGLTISKQSIRELLAEQNCKIVDNSIVILGDFRIYSKFSSGKLPIPEIVDIYGQVGFGVISITDQVHPSESISGRAAIYLDKTLTDANFPLYINMIFHEAKRAWEKYKMIVLPGVEFVGFSKAEIELESIIAIGIHEFINPNQEALDLLKEIREKSQFVVACPGMVSIESGDKYRSMYGNLIDAWECNNRDLLFEDILEAGVPVVANSQFKKPAHLASLFSRINAPRSLDAIFEAIKNKRLDVSNLEMGVAS